MKKRSLMCIVFGIILTILYISLPNESKATAPTVPVNFGISLVREGSATDDGNGEGKDAGTNIGYAIGNPAANTDEANRFGAIIWNIMKYQDTNGATTGEDGNYYCIREGKGFIGSNATSGVPKIETYSNSYDFVLNREQIKSISNINNLINSNENYYGLLALSDLLYIDGTNVDQFLSNAGINLDDYTTKLTITDVKAIQQAAIWYFTNKDQSANFTNIYDNLNKDSWLFYTTDGSEYSTLSDYDLAQTVNGKVGSGEDRNEQAKVLYNYLVNTAKTNASSYENGTIPSKSKITVYTNVANETNTQPIIYIEKIPEVKEFDLALSKYITKINDQELSGANSRIPNIDESTLQDGTTATYRHRKDPVNVKKDDKITYTLTIYNEGDKPGRATKIIDQLPTGLSYSKINTTGFNAIYDDTTNKITIERDSSNITNLDAYKSGNLKSESIEIECIVTANSDSTNDKVLTNVAWISEEFDSEDGIAILSQNGKDRDSEPATIPNADKDNMSDYKGDSSNKTDLTDSTYYYKGQQDDDDFEKVVLKPAAFDLKLIKRVVEVNGMAVDERLKNVDISKLANGTETTATYDIDKNPVSVKKGDIVKYTLRVYNEGAIDGYASEISEDIPEGLEFLWSEKETTELKADTTLTAEEKEAILYNQGIWDFSTINKDTEKVEIITTDYLAKGKGTENETTDANLIKAFDSSKEFIDKINNKNPDYKEVSVYLRVISENTTGTIIRNEAAITEDTDKDGNSIGDRDSDTEKWVKYEDDEDYDNLKLQSFDLALRKFIIAISSETTIKDEDYLKNEDGNYKRAPIVDTSKLNTLGTDGKLITTAIYNHSKEPVILEKGNYVVYNLRVYNEGDVNGYASEIKDYLPEYLQYVDCKYNQDYGWSVSTDGRIVTTTYLDNEIIEKTKKEDSKTIVSYKEVPIMCKVKDTAKTSENITNIAEIIVSKDENKKSIQDRDSKSNNVTLPSDDKLPSYKDEQKGDYIPGQEDDDDFEKVMIKSFDLALRKWVTQAIVTEDGKETVIETGHTPEQDQEPVVKVELNRKKLDKVTVKFKYSIRVTNEGDIAGYAKEITDYIPKGLKFIKEDNPNWKEENNKISTRALENTLLQPGESKDVQIVLTWINGKDNMGLKTNIAEISEDYNEKGIHDIDSTPDNKIPEEDDQDDAPVLLSVTTGQEKIYFILGFINLTTIAGGIILIKKFVM